VTSFIRSLAKATVTKMEDVLSRTALTGTAFDITDYEGTILVVLEAGAATAGTTPTLDVKLQHSDTSGGTYADVTGAAYTQVTTTASQQVLRIDCDAVKGFIKAVATYGGTSTPTFPFGLTVIGHKKYT